MHAWESIQVTVDYIEEHIGEEIDIKTLSEMAALSPFYYQRLFHRLVKKPVAEYIRLRRMAKAVEMLQAPGARILDVATELGFSSHARFTNTFKETFGMTPSEFRENHVALNRMTKPELLLNYALIDEGVPLVTDGIVLEITKRKLDAPVRFIGIQKDVPLSFMNGLGTESGVDPLDEVWNEFHRRKSEDFGLPEDAEELGVACFSKVPDCFLYFGGGKADASSKIPEGGAQWDLPEGEYAVCEFEAVNFEGLVMDALYKAEKYLFDIWLPKRGLKAGDFCAELYASHSPDTTSMQVWVRV